ncbi:MAG: response regulator transcription factor [Sphingomonas sp.]
MSRTDQPSDSGNVTILPLPGRRMPPPPPPGGTGRSRARLLIVDPRSLTRDCLVAALGDASDIESAIAVANLDEAVAITESTRIDAVIVNLAADPFSEADLATIVTTLFSLGGLSVIIVLANTIDPPHAAAALRQGVRVFLSSDTPFDRIIEAIRFACAGWTIYPAYDFSLLNAYDKSIFPTAERGTEFSCTPRQLQVLEGLERGLTNKSIALALGVSERTVKAHVKELMRRLKANNRTQVVALASHIPKSRSTVPPSRY